MAQVLVAEEIFAEAQIAAHNAAKACVPRPMIVGTPTTLLGNDIDPNKDVYYVAGGVCGFAGVKIRPARGALVAWLKKHQIGYRDDYAGGYYVSAQAFYRAPGALVQSYEINVAIAGAAAEVFRKYGIDAYVEARLD